MFAAGWDPAMRDPSTDVTLEASAVGKGRWHLINQDVIHFQPRLMLTDRKG